MNVEQEKLKQSPNSGNDQTRESEETNRVWADIQSRSGESDPFIVRCTSRAGIEETSKVFQRGFFVGSRRPRSGHVFIDQRNSELRLFL